MHTAEKRRLFKKYYPVLFDSVYKMLNDEQFRGIDDLINSQSDLPSYVKEYTITLLCDMLVALTNKNISED